MNRIVIVSNRTPSLDAGEARAGGLAVGLRAALEESGGLWLGWSGRIADAPDEGLQQRLAGSITLATMDLTRREYDGFYSGFSNRTLWPLMHGRVDLMRFDAGDFATYRAVNETFARHLVGEARAEDLVWVHDYHFLLLGKGARRRGFRGRMGFFLHVPFPSPEAFAALPCYRDVVEALSAYDLVGSQTENDVRNFAALVSRCLGGSVSGDSVVSVFGRRFRVGAFPIGIDARAFRDLAETMTEGRLGARLKECFDERLAIVGVDRLDYTKGLPNRLRAYERLLETVPELCGRTMLLQIAAPSRETVPEYCRLKHELETLSGSINARHGDVDWTPVRYLNRTVSQARLAAFYRLCRVGLVTPLRDGMNLVAKEYVASQDAADPGVLVLSRFAGAAEQLDAALIVNPYDIDAMARALRRALVMPLAERKVRWSSLMSAVEKHDVHDWRERFLAALSSTGAVRAESGQLVFRPKAPRTGSRFPAQGVAMTGGTRS